MEFDYKNVLIYGYEKSGRAVEDVLKDIGVSYKIYDKDLKVDGGNYVAKLNEKTLKQFDLIVISPAVSIYNKYIKLAERLGIKVIGELEFGFWFTSAEVIAVTGTNGKTTTTHLINLVLQKAGYKTGEYGNIGIPLTCAYKKDLDYIVCEVSSFQLESTDKFAPYVSVLLNVDEDHIDRHKTVENYINVKKSIFKNCDTTDYVVLNAADKNCLKMKDEVSGKKVLFNDKNGFNINKDKLCYGKKQLLKLNKDILNYTYSDNILALASVLTVLDVDLKVINEIEIDSKIPHRLEKFLTHNGVSFYDDSKATNPNATLKALEQFDGKVLLMLGGLDKGFNWKKFVLKFPNNIEKIVCFGKCGRKIYRTCKKCKKNVMCFKTLEIATNYVVADNNSCNYVLLSPACASFDEFSGYDKRGEFFQNLVKKLVK